MKKEEAIERIQQDLDVSKKYLSKEYKEALNMAIEALQAKTDGDLISRADALEQIAQAECGLHYEDCKADNCMCGCIWRILNISSTESKTRE